MSVYVQFDPWGRMGNRMFQYAFGYLLAKQKKTFLHTDGLPNFNIPPTLSVEYNKTSSITTKHYGDNFVDLEELTNTSKDIIVNSFVQKAHYYNNHRNELRDAFSIKPRETINRDKLVLHIRETDYKDLGCFLGYKLYKKVIDKAGFNNVIIVTDNSSCDTVQRLLKDGCILNTEGYVNTFAVISDDRGMHDFYTLLYSENIAISQSSFSWWAAFLGYPKNVYFLFSEEKGIWKTNPEKDDIDLFYNSEETHKLVL